MSQTEVPERARALAPAGVVGGIGGLAFVATVVAQNAMRASLPGNDASAGTVIAYARDHRSATAVLGVLFAIGAVGIATFTGGFLSRVRDGEAHGPAVAGTVGLAGIVALFATTVATDVAVSAYVHRGSPDPGVVVGLWLLHGAAFGILQIFIGIALAGLSAAAAANGLVPNAWKAFGLGGGILLITSGALTPTALGGSPVIALGLAGFLVWLVFVAFTSVRLLRTTADRHYLAANS